MRIVIEELVALAADGVIRTDDGAGFHGRHDEHAPVDLVGAGESGGAWGNSDLLVTVELQVDRTGLQKLDRFGECADAAQSSKREGD